MKPTPHKGFNECSHVTEGPECGKLHRVMVSGGSSPATRGNFRLGQEQWMKLRHQFPLEQKRRSHELGYPCPSTPQTGRESRLTLQDQFSLDHKRHLRELCCPCSSKPLAGWEWQLSLPHPFFLRYQRQSA